MDFITAYFVVISVSFVAMVSPGPDFLIVMRNALGVNRKSGVMTALGVGCAILVHVTYCILGIAVVISQSIVFFYIF
jgi:threonine/homoserine/homoserine lactone efflux protein